MKLIALLVAPALCLSIPMLASDGPGAQDPAKQSPGYDNTPMLPGQPWRVHDRNRPQPFKIKAPVQFGDAPSDAVVLFDGRDLSQWQNGKGEAAQWKIAEGAMTVNGTGSIRTKKVFGDCQLHVEWATPESSSGNSQGMGNSGVFLMGLYEIQVLDSHDNISYADGSAGSIYGQYPPDANASRAPGEWQTYDIAFLAPRYEDGSEVSPARITVFHNGVLVHNNRVILGPTTHQNLPPAGDYSAPGPLELQDHGNPVRYRNIWIRAQK